MSDKFNFDLDRMKEAVESETLSEKDLTEIQLLKQQLFDSLAADMIEEIQTMKELELPYK